MLKNQNYDEAGFISDLKKDEKCELDVIQGNFYEGMRLFISKILDLDLFVILSMTNYKWFSISWPCEFRLGMGIQI